MAAAVAVRLCLLGRQSYWIDELFSVNQSAGTLGTMLSRGSTEVHTPLYAALLWIWITIGGTSEAWTRLLSTACAVLAVVVTLRGLRGVRLGGQVRWALTAATAASGVSIVYSLETRPYALLLLGSVGLTAATLRSALCTLDGRPLRREAYAAWTAWSLVAATSHLFGAFLTLGAASVLAAVGMRADARDRGRRAGTWAGLAVAGCSVQIAWLVSGLTRPGFASGTGWIQAPDGQDLWDLVTTTFGSGALTARSDGFAWTSPLGVIMMIGVVGGAALGLAAPRLGYPARSAVTAATAEASAAAVLLAVATVVAGSAFVVSQWIHVWTLRNLVVVTPALAWGAICLAASVARSAAGRGRVAAVVVAMLGLMLVPTTFDLRTSYKTDFRALLADLGTLRASHPDIAVVFVRSGPPWGWQEAPGRSGDGGRYALHAGVPVTWVRSPGGVVRTPGTQVVIVYHGVAEPDVDQEVSVLAHRLGPSCRRIPMYGLGVLRCGTP
jgi:hypothetical protein